MTNEEIFEANKNIAYKIANRYLKNYKEEIEDIRQIALMELWRCVVNWDHIHTLTTYAYLCIPNKINMYLRKVRKYQFNLSISTSIFTDSDGNDLTFEDTIENDIDYIYDLIEYLDCKDIFDSIYLTDKEKELIKLRSNGLTQYQCAEILNVSQAQVSRTQNKIKKKMQNYILYGNKPLLRN